MSINNPNKLVEEFKKSGEFDRIRRELLAQFQSSEGLATFKSRVEDVARQRLTNDHNLLYMPQEFIHRELMQELDRFPIVERSTSELPILNDPALSTRIGDSLEKILKDQGVTVKALGSDEGNKNSTQNTHSGVSEEAGKQAQSSRGSDSQQPPAPDSNHSERDDKESASTLKGRAGKQEKDPDSMDLDED
ncbi:hypothetical protein P691DRAFT_807089 [Macrolepiota fuliginosa MF-IS2]|uniref:BOD1/SHG1 domain-containing protein n=1 Tax=Macrolepiota fuliginosa MF-IS2 TaxID=1400762 RepID=A0A9P5XIW3_9AGAR|nr:hypothetical protein P691DRAFT_807089 [Macrolepiota fuliginosa MF-IS2]